MQLRLAVRLSVATFYHPKVGSVRHMAGLVLPTSLTNGELLAGVVENSKQKGKSDEEVRTIHCRSDTAGPATWWHQPESGGSTAASAAAGPSPDKHL